MPRTILKRSAATLGVVAGLFAAAAPAGAQLPPTTIGVTTPKQPELLVSCCNGEHPTGKAPTLLDLAAAPFFNPEDVIDWYPAGARSGAIGTQIGSEG